MEQAPSQETENTQRSPMRAISLRIRYEYPLISRDKWRRDTFFLWFIWHWIPGNCWASLKAHWYGLRKPVYSIRKAWMHLGWLYQPRENRKGSLGGAQFHHGVAMWVHSGKDFRAVSSAKTPPPHHPTSSISAWRSWPTPHSAESPVPLATDPSHCHQKLCQWSISLLLLL